MISPPVWQLDEVRARLALGPIHGALDLTQPWNGLVAEQSQVLGLERTAVVAVGPAATAEAFVRGHELVASYDDWPSRQMRLDARWRAIQLHLPAQIVPAVDLFVSVHTERLDGHPQVTIASRLLYTADCPAWRLTGKSHPSAERVEMPHGVTIRKEDGPSCVVVRVEGADGPRDHVQMVYPPDLVQTELSRHARQLQIIQRLFPQSLEKGVVLRGRVRSVWLPSGAAEADVADIYAAFAAEPPYLGP